MIDPITTYQQHFGLSWANALEIKVPRHLHEQIVTWVLEGKMYEDDTIHAIAAGNLFETMRRCDMETSNHLRDICGFFRSYTPLGCWGSPIEVKRWRRAGGYLGGG